MAEKDRDDMAGSSGSDTNVSDFGKESIGGGMANRGSTGSVGVGGDIGGGQTSATARATEAGEGDGSVGNLDMGTRGGMDSGGGTHAQGGMGAGGSGTSPLGGGIGTGGPGGGTGSS